MTASDYFASRENAAFFIAEIGGNHEGSYDCALKLCDLAIQSGADAIKFQLYRGDQLAQFYQVLGRRAAHRIERLASIRFDNLAP